jgi:hypothetical protein
VIAILATALLLVAPPLVEQPPLVDLSSGATVDAPAERIDPPPPPPVEVATPVEVVAPAGLSNCDEMSWYRKAAGLPARFDQLGWRESNCRNEDGVHTSCCYGWWQLNVGLHLRDRRLIGAYHRCGVWSAADVNSDTPSDKLRQACAAKALYDVVGYSAWSTS